MPKLQSRSLSPCGQQLKGRFLTYDILKKKGIILVDQCCMCRCDGEMVDHIYFIVKSLMLCAAMSFVCLGFNG